MSTMTTITTTERRSLLTAAALCAAVAAGCGYQGPFADLIDDEKLSPPGDPETPSRLSASAARGEPPDELVISGDADVEEFVRLALERNPAIRAAHQKVRRLANRIPQARSLDDPMFSITPIGEMAETAAGEVELMTSVSQKLPLPGKIDARGRIVAADVGEAFQELQRVRLDVAADTRRAWWSLYFTTRAVEVTTRNRDLLAQLTDVAEARYRAGTATQQDVLRASVEMNKLDGDLIELEQRRATASAMLNRLVDRPVDAPLPVPQARDPDPLILELDAVLAMAGQSNPDIARVRERIEGFRQRLELARLNRWPDLTLSFSYNLVENDGLSPVANGDDQWWVGAGINLPIWADRLDAAESEAARGIFQSIAALGDVQNRVAFRVQDALVRAESQQRQVVLFRDVIIPQARQTVDASLSGYRAGKLDFLTLVDNWRRLFEFEVIYHQDLTALEQSLADLQQAVGRNLDLAATADAGAAVQEPQP
jgi:cobalt-zinc-cadmium efflux system outer membrane protein